MYCGYLNTYFKVCYVLRINAFIRRIIVHVGRMVSCMRLELIYTYIAYTTNDTCQYMYLKVLPTRLFLKQYLKNFKAAFI